MPGCQPAVVVVEQSSAVPAVPVAAVAAVAAVVVVVVVVAAAAGAAAARHSLVAAQAADDATEEGPYWEATRRKEIPFFARCAWPCPPGRHASCWIRSVSGLLEVRVILLRCPVTVV